MSTFNKFASLDDAYQWVLDAILSQGEQVAPRTLPTRELRSVGLTITDPRRRYVSLRPRRWSIAYALGEFCWHARASDRLDDISFYSDRWREMSDDGVTVSGSCYGAKIFRELATSASQWKLVRRTLEADPASRRAILDFSDKRHPDAVRSRDVNCATTLQFLVRAGGLEAVATMRSNDVILGLPYDVFLFTMLQEMMAVELNLDIGPYHHFVGSLHIYDSNLPSSREIVAARPSISQPMPRMLTTTDIGEFLRGEQQTRDPTAIEFSHRTADKYWNQLLDVLRYCNATRLGKPLDPKSIIDSPLYRELVNLRVGSGSRQLPI